MKRLLIGGVAALAAIQSVEGFVNLEDLTKGGLSFDKMGTGSTKDTKSTRSGGQAGGPGSGGQAGGPGSAVPAAVCGDGIRAPTEECDDGANNGPSEICSEQCTIDPSTICYESGSSVIVTAGNLATLQECSKIIFDERPNNGFGGLVFDNTSPTTVTFPNLRYVTNIEVTSDNSMTTSLSFPKLAKVEDDLRLDGDSLNSISLPELSQFSRLRLIDPPLTTLDFPSLRMAQFLQFDDPNTNMQSISFPELVVVGSSTIKLGNFASLTSFTAPKLRSVENLSLADSDGNGFQTPLSTLDLPSLERIGQGLTIQSSQLTTFRVPLLEMVETIDIGTDGDEDCGGMSCCALTGGLDFPVLTVVGESYEIQNCLNLGSLTQPKLEIVGSGALHIRNVGFDTGAELSFPSLIWADEFEIDDTTGLVLVSAPKLKASKVLQFEDNLDIVTVDLPRYLYQIEDEWDVKDNAALKNFNAPLLKYTEDFEWDDNNALEVLSFPSLLFSGDDGFEIDENLALKEINFPSLIFTDSLEVRRNSMLEKFSACSLEWRDQGPYAGETTASRIANNGPDAEITEFVWCSYDTLFGVTLVQIQERANMLGNNLLSGVPAVANTNFVFGDNATCLDQCIPAPVVDGGDGDEEEKCEKKKGKTDSKDYTDKFGLAGLPKELDLKFDFDLESLNKFGDFLKPSDKE
uniref:Uncharacterized protein n=1 Tax=Chromera velia CCMP2878 TaxID=1169474 RepID=A0A0G4HRW5_9ALVE|eukprot:Cvel_30766.t1-p1 / transcript=Cvel_30766.t1 / gene=Cvel_30766 / organism=Chromera_velia_CCMP2878 / gene_product=hypothetical protein / transcript_product=hypothetical protein / location=Cvel_scaffold4446:5034-8909(-) / protein_length=688 / sequence_SO=supercontig / SO=protein_coding / is_pseudo=false